MGFVILNQLNNRLFFKVLKKGDIFVFLQGLIHFQLNVGKMNAVAFSALVSHNAGRITIGNSVIGTKPLISANHLTQAFQVDNNVKKYLQAQFW